MSYQVIARKWRSKTFEELVGQDHITTTLINALKSNRLPHAILFTGPRGTGKTSSARILAKSLRCTGKAEGDFTPCNTCDSCSEINAGNSMDVIEIDGASNNGVDSVRDLREGVGYMPSSGKIKVYIIDEVHMLSTSAFNALLKTLEEPPDHVVFVLATTEIQKIPNTILSRCQRFDFRRISTRQIADHLSYICQQDKIEFDEESIWLISRQGDGSMRDAQSLLDQVITFCNGKLVASNVIQVLGLTDRGLLNRTTQCLANRDKQQIIEITQNVLDSGYDSKIFIEELLEQLRNLLMIKIGSSAIDLPDSEIEFLTETSQSVAEEDIHFLFDMALKGSSEIHRLSNPSLAFEMLLLRMVAAPKMQAIADIFAGGVVPNHSPAAGNTHSSPSTSGQQRPTSSAPRGPSGSKTEQRAKSSPNQEVNTQPSAQVHPSPSSAETTGGSSSTSAAADRPAKVTIKKLEPTTQNWIPIVNQIKQLDPKAGAMLENLAIEELDEQHLKLSLPAKLKFLEKQVMQSDFTQKLKSYVAKIVGHELKISLAIAGADNKVMTTAAIQKKKAETEQRDVEEAVRNHPSVKSATQMFKGQIKEISEIKETR